MPTRVGPKMYGQENLVFAYDVGDTTNCYLGEPTKNLATLDLDDTSTWYNEDAATTIREKQSETLFGYPVYKIKSRPGQIWVSPVAFNGFDRTVDDVTLSAYIRNVSASATVSTYFGGDFSTDSLGTSNYQTIPTDGEWRRYQWTRFSGSMVANQLEFRTSGPGILISCPQVEYGRRATQLLDGSRSVSGSLLDLTGTSTIDLSNISFDSNSQITFAGSSNYLSFSYTQANPNLFSVEAVFYHTAHSSDTNIGHILVMPYNGYNAWIFSLNGTNSKLQLRHHNYDLSSTSYNVAYTTGLDLNKWYHVMATDDGINVNLYVNGALVKTQASAVSTTNGTMPCKIGSWPTTNTSFAGEIPIVKIYNRALTADEVSANYRALKGRFNI